MQDDEEMWPMNMMSRASLQFFTLRVLTKRLDSQQGISLQEELVTFIQDCGLAQKTTSS